MFNFDGNLIKVRFEDVKIGIKNQPKGIKIAFAAHLFLILLIAILTANLKRKIRGWEVKEAVSIAETSISASVIYQILLGPEQPDGKKNVLDWRIIQGGRQLTCVKQPDQDSI